MIMAGWTRVRLISVSSRASQHIRMNSCGLSIMPQMLIDGNM